MNTRGMSPATPPWATARPFTTKWCHASGSSETNVSWPLSAPTAIGEKSTVTVSQPPAGIVSVVRTVWKCGLSLVTALIVSGAVPGLQIVSVSAGTLRLTSTTPMSSVSAGVEA